MKPDSLKTKIYPRKNYDFLLLILPHSPVRIVHLFDCYRIFLSLHMLSLQLLHLHIQKLEEKQEYSLDLGEDSTWTCPLMHSGHFLVFLIKRYSCLVIIYNCTRRECVVIKKFFQFINKQFHILDSNIVSLFAQSFHFAYRNIFIVALNESTHPRLGKILSPQRLCNILNSFEVPR